MRHQTTLTRLILTGLLLWLAHGMAKAAFTDSPVNVSRSATDAGYPAVAVGGTGNIGIVWADRYDDGGTIHGNILFRGAADGQTLGSVKVVDEAGSVDDQSWEADIAADADPTSDVMHVVWRNWYQQNESRIYYAACSNAPDCTAREEVTIATNPNLVSFPRIAANATNLDGLHTVWVDDQTGSSSRTIMYRGKRAGDSSFANAPAAVQLSAAEEFAGHPAIAVSESGGINYVHVVWAADTDKDGDNDRITYRRGPVNAVTGVVDSWEPAVVRNMPVVAGSEAPDYPAVTAAGEMVVVLWDVYQTNSSPADAYYGLWAESTDNGDTFSVEAGNIPVSMIGAAETYTPRLSDNQPGSATNGLLSSEHAQRLQIQATLEVTTTPGISPALHIAWHQSVREQGDVVYKHDVFHARRGIVPDEGFSWLVSNETESRKYTPDMPAYSMSPDIAVDRTGKVRVVYMESKQVGEYEVINPYNPTDELTVIDVIYNGNAVLVDNIANVYLPVVLK